MHNQPREPQSNEDCQAKSIQEFGWTSLEVFCHAKLRQQLKQKEPLPSIEYI